MNRRQFSLLLVAVIMLMLAVALLPENQHRNDQVSGNLLLRHMGSRMNEVDMVRVTAGGGSWVTTLIRGDSSWVIEELESYPADWQKLKSVLANLAAAKVVEIKTSKPEYYSRLGVENVSTEGAGNVLLELFIGDEVREIIIGNKAASGRGQFVRFADDRQSVLIDQSLELNGEPVSWADNEILDIASSMVADIEIAHSDGDLIKLKKVSADDTDFLLENLPDGQKIISSWSLNSLGGIFSMLNMEDVKPDNSATFPDPVLIKLLTFSGLEVTAQAASLEDGAWIRINAGLYENTQPDAADDQHEDVPLQPAQEAEAINRKLDGWLYRIPESKFEAMTRRLEQLIETDESG